jgi:hypothetical protein
MTYRASISVVSPGQRQLDVTRNIMPPPAACHVMSLLPLRLPDWCPHERPEALPRPGRQREWPCYLTFPHKLCPRDALPDLILVGEVRLRHEGAVQPWPEVVVTLRILTTEEEELCV